MPAPRSRTGPLVAGGIVAAGGAVLIVCATAGHAPVPARTTTAAPAADGLPHTAIRVTAGSCGTGWSRPHPGQQVFDVRNDSAGPAEVDLYDPATGAVLGEVEGLAPGTTRPLQVTLGSGAFAFKCLPDDGDAVIGPTVRVPGHAVSGPAAVPVTQHDLIPPAIAYQKWIGARLGDLADAVATLRSDVDRGDLDAARTAWLPAHLVYERLGAAYGTFGDADKAINGTTAGLPKGADDPGFTGFHRLEQGLWHGESADRLRPVADRLATDVDTLRDGWSQARLDPAQLGLRAHEILENTERFEITGRTDYGSGSNLATARANLDGTRTVLGYLRPLLTTRYPALPRLDALLDRLQHTLDSHLTGGRPTPVDDLTTAQRERLHADLGQAVERLADIAALFDVRRTS
nr:EfeM/EfeO family lipoprotein [Streptomyces sp. SID5468]